MIEVIGSPTCQPCKMVKAILDKQGTEYTYHSIGEEPSHLPQVRSVPAIFKDGTLVGYGVNAVKKL